MDAHKETVHVVRIVENRALIVFIVRALYIQPMQRYVDIIIFTHGCLRPIQCWTIRPTPQIMHAS